MLSYLWQAVTLVCVALLWMLPVREVQARSLFVDAQSVSVSQPVPVYDMIHGWQQDYRDGKYAFTDTRWRTGVEWQGARVFYEQRVAGYLSFNTATARVYQDIEQGNTPNAIDRMALDVRYLTARGMGASYSWQWGAVTWQPTFVYYHVDQYQFGRLRGWAQSREDISAFLDYYYHEDKLLDDKNVPGVADGVSLSMRWRYQQPQWALAVSIDDAFNRWYLNDAGHTVGCVRLGGEGTPVCETSSAIEGSSNPKTTQKQLLPTWRAHADWLAHDIELDFLKHDRYQRMGVTRWWSLDSFKTAQSTTRIGVTAYSTRQLGLQFQHAYGALMLASDDWRWRDSRALDVSVSLRLPF